MSAVAHAGVTVEAAVRPALNCCKRRSCSGASLLTEEEKSNRAGVLSVAYPSWARILPIFVGGWVFAGAEFTRCGTKRVRSAPGMSMRYVFLSLPVYLCVHYLEAAGMIVSGRAKASRTLIR